MALYVDTHLIVDTTRIAEAHPIDGSGEYDGMYFICLLLYQGEIMMERVAVYPTKELRDKGFCKLGKLMVTRVTTERSSISDE